jgi:protein-S-isoprenylcysteine O-methyltransferase Ste14
MQPSQPEAPHVALPSRTVTRQLLADLLARATIVSLFTLLSVNILANFLHTGQVTGLLLLASESLVVVMTVARRRAQAVDRSVAAAVLTAVSLIGPPLVRAADVAPLAPDAATVILSAIGLGLVLVGKIALGRSFGLVPANRGVVVRGPYSMVRHPIYTGYLITHIGFLMAQPTPWNAGVFVVADVALVLRALMEERILSADVDYQQYCRKVGWHLVPGVF